MRVWPNTTTGGTDITMTIDTGLVAEELHRSMASAIATGELTRVLGEALSLWRSGLTGPLADFVNVMSDATENSRRLEGLEEASFNAIGVSLVMDLDDTRRPEAIPIMTVSNLHVK